MTSPHAPAAGCEDRHCYAHDADEEPAGAWRVCGECFHVFAGPADLQREWAANAPPDLPGRETAPPVEMIYFCPLCAHDW